MKKKTKGTAHSKLDKNVHISLRRAIIFVIMLKIEYSIVGDLGAAPMFVRSEQLEYC